MDFIDTVNDRIYRRSEQRSYNGPHFPTSIYNDIRPKVKTVNLTRETAPIVNRVNSKSHFKVKDNTSIIKNNKPLQPSLSSKIKANLNKSKNKTLGSNIIKLNKNKTLLRTKQSFEKNYFKAKTIKDSNQKLVRKNTLKQFSRQNSGKAMMNLKKGGLRQKLKQNTFGFKRQLSKKDSKNMKVIPKKIQFGREKIKHIGNIKPETQDTIKESVLISNMEYEKKDQEIAVTKTPKEDNNELMIMGNSVEGKDDNMKTPQKDAQEEEDNEITLNPFMRKSNQHIDLKLPDMGLISNEKDKENQTNLTDRKVDEYMNRRKTKYSKEVAKYIEDTEEIRSPLKKKKKVKVIKMKWRNSIKAYAKVTEYEEKTDEEEELKTPVKSPIQLKEESNEMDINRLKKFVNTPKNIKSQLRPEDNLLSPLKNTSQKQIFDFKKSHSTFNLQSTMKDTKNKDKSIPAKEISQLDDQNTVLKTFQRRETTFFEEKKKHFFPIFENFGNCPRSMYRLIIYKMDKNSKTDKIFFNNPTNYTFPEKLLTFDIEDSRIPQNMSHSLVWNLKCEHQETITKVDQSSRYHDMSQVVNLNKTLKPSLYHDLNALELDFSFPEDKPKSPKRPKFFKLGNGAEQIDEFTFRIGGIEFKDYRGKKNAQSSTNLHTSNSKSSSHLLSGTNSRMRITQNKSTSNLLSNSHVMSTSRNGNI